MSTHWSFSRKLWTVSIMSLIASVLVISPRTVEAVGNGSSSRAATPVICDGEGSISNQFSSRFTKYVRYAKVWVPTGATVHSDGSAVRHYT